MQLGQAGMFFRSGQFLLAKSLLASLPHSISLFDDLT